ncbi:Uncharacterized conserved protein YraI [Devosia crocina]|uniref:Uncharacterized conserved protein YraI n=1 Tax=Devosia crocina TaxID=429728 RepID=A0A1I7N548_9HYPH|nr:SH3 domain-containing protein [Devosia crocina]SFV29794.1 Uncharacterized conserved protein YraI [Devosia crocina]
MALNRKLIASGLATLAVLATTVAASAATAYATGNVNVRNGPGTGYRVVDTLIRGQRVDVQYCQGSWCFIEKRGPNGWVSSNYLSNAGWDDDYYAPRPPRPPVWNPAPPRPPHWNPRPPRPPHWNQRPQPVIPAPYPSRPSGSFCFNGPNGYFCAGN